LGVVDIFLVTTAVVMGVKIFRCMCRYGNS
jgi:hypothetical protein